MKIGFNISGPIGAVVPFCAPYGSEVEFSTRYVWEAAFAADMHGYKTFVTSDGSNRSRATRQNSRHLNLVLLCGASDSDHGSIYISHRTSALNRRRVIKAAAMLSSLSAREISVIDTEGGSEEDLSMRGYKAFCWLVRLPFTQDCKNAGHQLLAALRYAYDLQDSDNASAGRLGSNTAVDRGTTGASYSW